MPIRKVIELLCRILDENGVCSVKAETLRKAKFNDDDVVPVLWKLVYSVLCYGNDITMSTEMRLEDIDFTKIKLLEKQYYSNEMLNLPPDMSYGSRELLLAFGWIFCNDQLICRLIHNRTIVFEDSDENLLSAFGIATEIPDAHQDKLQSLESDTSDPYIKIQQLLILNNKLRLNLYNLHSFQRELYTLKHKIYEATSIKDANELDGNHLSILELQLLKSPDKLKKYLDLLEKDNRCLENLLKWKECQEVFWKWMGSVLDLKISQHPQSKQLTKPDIFSKVQCAASNRLSETCEDLEDILSEYDGLLNQLQKLCLEKPDDIPADELNSMMLLIEGEIKKYKLSSQNAKSLKQTPVFQLEEKAERKATAEDEKNFLEVMKEARLPDELKSIDIQNETRKLRNEISHLEAYLVMQQNKLRTELDQLNAKMDGYYCIPPLRKSK